MAWPASVITREISFGKAVVLETGQDLSLRVSTRASRSLVSLAEGFRMEALVAAFETSEPGDEIVFPLPVTNQPGWADAATRQGIEVGEDEHSHLYTTTLTIYSGSSQIRQYTIGPYPVPQGEGMLDGDTMLVPSGTQPGALVPLPEIWEQIITEATALLDLRGEPQGIATLDNNARVPMGQLPLPAIASSGAMTSTYAAVVEHGANADVARPTSNGVVLWIGSVTPTNAQPGDLVVSSQRKSAFIRHTAGDITITSGTMIDLGVEKLTMRAAVGDLVLLGINGKWSGSGGQTGNARLTLYSENRGGYVKEEPDGPPQPGVAGWYGPALRQEISIGAAYPYEIAEGDVDANGLATFALHGSVGNAGEGVFRILKGTTSDNLIIYGSVMP